MNNTPFQRIIRINNVDCVMLTDAEFLALTNALMRKFGGDEGHDIGDACHLIELIANTCTDDETHNDYTPTQMRHVIAALIPTDVYFSTAMRFIETVCHLPNSEFNDLIAKY